MPSAVKTVELGFSKTLNRPLITHFISYEKDNKLPRRR